MAASLRHILLSFEEYERLKHIEAEYLLPSYLSPVCLDTAPNHPHPPAFSLPLYSLSVYLSLLYCILFISFFLHMHRRNKYRRRCRFYNTHAQKPGLSAQVHTEGGAVLLSLYYTKLSGKQVNIFTICNTGLGMLGRVCLTKVPCQQFHFLDTNAK